MSEIHRFSVAMMAMLIPITAIIGAFVFVIVRTLAKSRVRELEIKEHIAMIDRGLVPPPEVDPPGFERALHREERARGRSCAGRHRRSAIILLGVGFGLMVLITFAGGDSGTGIGVGGFLVVLGLAFFISSFFEFREAPPAVPGGNARGSAPAAGPPDSIPPS